MGSELADKVINFELACAAGAITAVVATAATCMATSGALCPIVESIPMGCTIALNAKTLIDLYNHQGEYPAADTIIPQICAATFFGAALWYLPLFALPLAGATPAAPDSPALLR